jgi:DNA-binding transcriptional regulator YiaG
MDIVMTLEMREKQSIGTRAQGDAWRYPLMTPDQLTATREKLGMTKTELARELRVEWLTVHRWELPLDHKENRGIPNMVEAFLERLLKEKRK